MRSLIVTLPPTAAQPSTEYEFVLTADGQGVLSHGRAAAALLPQPEGAGAETVAVVPARMLSWHAVELPKGVAANSPRLRSVLEGLLEDRLLDEPEALHFALAPPLSDGAPVWVAVCDRAWLRTALQALEAAQRPVSRIVPEATPGPLTRLWITGEPQQADLVLAGPDGVLAGPLSALAALPLPEDTEVCAEPGVVALAEQSLTRQVLLQPAAQRQVLLQPAAQRQLLAAQSAWDLAQFDLASAGRTRALKTLAAHWASLRHAPRWRAFRWAALVLVLAHFAGLNAWAWKEQRALQAKRAAVQQVLTGSFPQVRVVVDAPVQMAREVAALRQATGAASSRDLEAMLSALGASAGTTSALAALEFTPGELRVRGPGLAPADSPAIAPRLAPFGYRVAAEGDRLLVRPEAAR